MGQAKLFSLFNSALAIDDSRWCVEAGSHPSKDLTMQADSYTSSKIQADALSQWVAGIVAAHGGVMTSANLGSALSCEQPDLYRMIKVQFFLWGRVGGQKH